MKRFYLILMALCAILLSSCTKVSMNTYKEKIEDGGWTAFYYSREDIESDENYNPDSFEGIKSYMLGRRDVEEGIESGTIIEFYEISKAKEFYDEMVEENPDRIVKIRGNIVFFSVNQSFFDLIDV